MKASPKADDLPLPPLPTQRFKTASVDFPWHYETRAAIKVPEQGRTPQRHYPTMSLPYIKAFPMQDFLEPDANLFVWMTGPLLARGVHYMLAKAWDLELASMAFVWIKLNQKFDTGLLSRTPLLERDLFMSMGYTTRQNAEFVVLMKRGAGMPRRLANIRQVIVAPVREHSRKPEEYFRRAELYSEGPRCDIFAGAERPNWTSWGWPHRDGERPQDGRVQG